MPDKVKVRKCHICGLRPASSERGFCHNCQAQLEADKRHKRPQKPFRFVTYRGVVVAFHRNGEDKLIPTFSTRNPETLPAKITINLDKYVAGLTREQVKKLKRQCKSFTKIK